MNPTMDTKIMTILDGISSLKKEQKVLVDTVDRLDERRNVKFHDTFPELHHFYEKCKTLNK